MEYNPAECHKYLKIEAGATLEEAEASYKKLKAKYSEDRFKEGEAGRKGAVNLSNLEEAYKDFCASREKGKTRVGPGTDLKEIDDMVKANKLDEAQAALDALIDRPAHWHYLQAIVFYKRSWFSECRNQLKLAATMEPGNMMYSGALQRLDMETGAAPQFAENGAFRPAGAPLDNSMGMGNCCSPLCLAPCCCC